VKRALFLTYYLPPRPAIASVRAGHIVHALRASGWEVVVLTPDGDLTSEVAARTAPSFDFKAAAMRMLGARKGVTASEHFSVTPASRLGGANLAQRAISYGRRTMEFANGRFGWIAHGMGAARALVHEVPFDAIVSTSPPEGPHLIAAAVHGEIPWIADLRDPWARDDELASPPPLRAIDRILERNTLRTASLITTVSQPIADRLQARYPRAHVVTLRNAFDRREWEGIPFVHPERATFLHAGQLYEGHRDPRPFFEATAHLLREGLVRHDEIAVDFYGEREPWIDAAIARFGLRAVVHLRGKRRRDEILGLERAASRLVVVAGRGKDEVGTYTAKLFEYFGARRPILAVGGPHERSVMDDALESTGAGRRYRSAKALRDAILEAVAEWRTGKTRIVSPDAVAQYELTGFIERFGEILRTCEREGAIA
jgi:hypothetical protein